MKCQPFAAFLSILLVQAYAQGQTYSVTDLGASLGGASHAQAINNKGQVVGYWSAPDGMHAFLFDAGIVKDLGNLGGTNIYALSINDAGQVAGVAETPSGMQAFLYQDGSLTSLGTLGGINSYAYAINKFSQIVGYIDTADGARAFVYKDGAKIELGTLGGTNTFAYGLNANLQVAGSSLTADSGSLHAFFWQTNSIMDLNGLLATPGAWDLQEARAINDFGQIVGSGILNQHEHAFLYDSGTVVDLGVLSGGTNSYALSVNNKLEIVGASSTPFGVHPFIWRGGSMADLNTFLSPNSGWQLREASGINDLGQIVGRATVDGQEHAFLLTPVGTTTAAVSPAKAQKSGIRPRVDSSFTVTITNPVNNAQFAAPTNVTIGADVSDSYGNVTQIQFFAGTNLLGTAVSSPYSVTWINPPVGTYGLTAVASDDLSLSTTSAVVNVTVTLPSPSSIKLWLNSSVGTVFSTGTNITRWQDQSGHANDATQSASGNQPVLVTNALNGLPVVHFDGNNRFFNLPNFMSSATQGEAFVVLRAAQDTPSVGRSLWRFGTSYYPEQYTWTDGIIYEDFGNSTRPSIGDPPQPLDQFHVFGVDSTSAELAIRFNGQAFYRNPVNTVAFSSSPTLGSSTGNNGGTAYFEGDIAEVLIYNQVLNAQQRDAVDGYLNSRYAFAPAPPSPSNLVAQAISSSQISLTWSEAFNWTAPQVNIERKTGSSGSYVAVAQIGAAALSFVDTNLTAGTTYFYRVRASNFGTASDYSNEAQATTLATGTDMPMNNLLVWLKADTGASQLGTNSVSLWSDQSGKGNYAYQATAANQPIWVAGALNGSPVLHFNGTNSYLNWPNILYGTTNAEAFVVLRAATNLPSTAQGLWRFGGSYYGGSAGGAYPDTTGAIQDDFGSVYYVGSLGVPAQPLNQFHVYEVAAAQNGIWTAWLNGQMQVTGSPLSYGQYYSYFYLGFTGSRYFAGDIAEVLIFNRTLTASERLTVNEYVNGKYGLVPAVPAAPTNLVAQTVSATQIGLTWNETFNQGATQVSIERKTGTNGTYAAIAQLSSATSYLDTNLTGGTTYFYRVRAINLTSWSDYSNEAQATTLASGTDVPLTNLVLWLKADSGLAQIGSNTPVSFWADQSGRANHATQTASANQPLWEAGMLNGMPVIHFNGTNSYLNWPNILYGTTNAEAFVVLRAATNLPSTAQGLWRFGGSYYGGSAGGAYPDTTGAIQDDFGSVYYVGSLGVPAQPLNQFHVYEVAAAQNGIWTAWLNGQMQVTGSPLSYGQYYSYFYLGFTGSRYFAGDIAEVLIFNRTLTASERLTVNEYVNGKYGLVPAVPAAPTNLVAQTVSATQIGLTWNETFNQGATQVSIERKTGTNGTYAAIAQLSSATSYLDTNLTTGTTYFYRVRAINLASWSDYSNEAHATTLASGTDVPLTNLVLWLKADTGLAQIGTNTPVSFWADQSGKANHATQTASVNQPLWEPGMLNGMPVLHFNGTNSYLNWPNLLYGTTNAEAFVVLRAATNLPSTAQGLWRFGGSYYGGAVGGAYPDTTGAIQDDFGSEYYVYGLGVPPQPLNQFHAYEVAAAQNGSWTAWLNGQMQTTAGGLNYGEYLGYFYLGFTGTRYFAGDVAEVLVFSRVLTADERETVGLYLTSKFGLDQFALDGSAPGTPTNFLVTALSSTQLQLSWNRASTNETGFEIERKIGTNGVYQTIASLGKAVTNFLDTATFPTNQYFYRLRARNYFGRSSYSAEISPPMIALTAPADLSMVWVGSTNTLTASAQASQGSLSKVDFFVQGSLFGTAALSPYNVNWVVPVPGDFQITALATDSQGNTRYCSQVRVSASLDIAWGPGDPPPPPPNNHIAPNIFLNQPAGATLIP